MPEISQFATREEYNAWFRAYRESKREYFRKYNREYNKAWRAKNGFHSELLWKKRNPDKIKAQRKLQKAVKIGKIKRLPCSVCGSAKSVGHHPDYSKPLEVIWLCHIHHKKVHYTIFPKRQRSLRDEELIAEFEKRKRQLGLERKGRVMRNTEIQEKRKQGKTLSAIGKDYGITRERIRQILLYGQKRV